ncbi:Protein of unknown function [Collimonas sp. OK607]|nr:Protein of unknown function [Collimonas sp. OK607]
MKMNKKLSRMAIALLAVSEAGAAHAGTAIPFDNGMTLDWGLDTFYTLASRVHNPNSLLAGPTNAGGNDGDNNFKKGTFTANRIGALFTSKLSKGDSGLVMSGSTFYDAAYHGHNDNPGPINNPGPVNQFPDQTQRYQGGYTRLLDAYGYTSFNFGDSSRATVRLGRHVVSWGEGLFFPSISLAQGPADGTKIGIPGTVTRDVLLPEDQLSSVIQVTPKWSLLTQLQYNFHETLAPSSGSYLNTSDGVGPGGTCLGPDVTIPAVPGLFKGFSGCSFGVRGNDIKPGRFGQWGIGTRYRVTSETEIGLYFLNYNDRTPLPVINSFTPGTKTPAFFNIAGNQIGNGSYQVRYFNDVKLLGSTFSTTFGAVTLAGELSYKMGAPVLVNTVVNPATNATVPNPTRADITQVNLNAFANLGRSPIADSVLLLGEISAIGVNHVQAIQAPGVDALGAAAAAFPSSDKLTFTNRGIAAQGQIVLGYPGITPNWDLTVPISYAQQLKGRTLTGGVGGQGDKRASFGASFIRNNNLAITFTYLAYLGSPSLDLVHYRALTDRNQVSVDMKYSF